MNLPYALPFLIFVLQDKCPTVCVTCAGAWLNPLWDAEKTPQREKRLGMPQNPQRQVHALLARFCCARLDYIF